MTRTPAPAGPGHLVEVDELTVWTVVDNTYDALRPDAKLTRRARAAPGRSFHAEHGLSFWAETVVGGARTAAMYDFGVDPHGVTNNLALLGLDLARVTAFALSHGHWDHYSSAAAILGAASIAPGTPFYVGEEAFAHRWSLRPGSAAPVDLGTLRREDVEATGVEVVEVRAPTQIAPGAYLTGNIERITPYEVAPPGMRVQRGDALEHDTFPGEQALLFHVRGKGLVVVAGCAHAGIVNTIRHALRVAGTARLLAVLGGFHLSGATAEVVERTVADVKALEPEIVVPAHCTGFEATVAFARAMPDAFVPNTVGARFTFGG